MKTIYVVEWQNEAAYAFRRRADAVRQIEEITGKAEDEWSYDNGDYDDYGNMAYLLEADLMDDDVELEG